MIRSIIERTGVKIDVEDDGRVNVASADGASAQKAISIIQELTATPELNKTYLGKIQRITDFGAFVEIMPGTEGLLHISQIAEERTRRVEDVLREGDMVLVKVIEVDPSGKVRLSRRAALKDPEATAAGAEHLTGTPDASAPEAVGGGRGDRGGDRERGGDRDRGGDRGRGGHRYRE
jgi:polyribonucleotide nucleotidyltransferase